MKINKILPKNHNVAFGKNKTYIYADFDRTLSPATTADIFYGTNKKVLDNVKANFDLFNQILDKYKDVVLIITTGRSNIELKRMFELCKNNGIDFIKANAIITKEGADSYLRDDSIINDYPFVKQNTKRNKKISVLTNWNKETILKDTLNIIKQNNLDPLECETTLSVEKYKDYTIFSHPEKISSKTIFVRNVGELKLFLGVSDEIPEASYTKLKTDVCNYLSSKGINFSVVEKRRNTECANYRTLMFMPIIDNQPLAKQYDIKEHLKNLDDTDIVIVAGDGKNDEEMLNPLSYTKTTDKNTLKTFPFLGMVVKKENEPEPSLEELLKKYGKDSDFPCLKEIPEGTLAEEIRILAEKKYSV